MSRASQLHATVIESGCRLADDPAQVVSVPLVLHGTSGVPDDAVRECVARGMCKVNYATDLRIAFSKGLKEYLAGDPEAFDPKKYSAVGREQVKEYVMSKILVCGSNGKA